MAATLTRNTHGKGRVRVMRVHRDGDRHEVRELTVRAMVAGDFGQAFTDADNSTSVSTDTIRNVVNVVARENVALDTEPFCAALAERLLGLYAQVETATVTAHEAKWTRLSVDGAPHPHGFVLDGNGKPFAEVAAARGGRAVLRSGVSGFTFLKTTGSGWADFAKDLYTTIPETRDRLCSTSMDAGWRWRATPPGGHAAANALVLGTMLEVFAGTYSHSVQDSIYRMAEAALDAVPEIDEITLACPNKHYLPIDLSRFGLSSDNQVFLPTDEPHGQIECTVARG
jgi:urate oxidase